MKYQNGSSLSPPLPSGPQMPDTVQCVLHTFTGAWAQTLPPQDVEHLSRACVALLTTTFELAKKESIPPALVVLQPAVTRIWYILPLSVKHANPPVSKH